MKKPILLYLLIISFTAGFAQNKKIDSLLVVLQKSKNDIDKTQTLNAIADAYKTSDPKLMQQYAIKALQLAQKLQYKIEEGNAQLNLGNSAIILGNYSQALACFSRAQSIFENKSQTDAKSSIYNNKWL